MDRKGKCAGNYAVDARHDDIVQRLVNAGVMAELLFSTLEKNSQTMAQAAEVANHSYLNRNVTYSGDDLLDEQRRGVMMRWEQPIMEIHASMLCNAQGEGQPVDILNIGFGLGLIDTAIQTHSPRSAMR